jgi:hypothetical protein
MFLYYVIAKDLSNLDTLLASNKIQNQLGIRYDRTTIAVLDLYMAQLQDEDLRPDDATKLLVDRETLKGWFAQFESWFNAIKKAKVPRIGTNSSTKIALFISAASQVWGVPSKVTEDQWQLIQVLLTQGPAKIEDTIGLAYPITKGKWPGQRTQIDKTAEICRKIAER